jgi:hypothetical protein
VRKGVSIGRGGLLWVGLITWSARGLWHYAAISLSLASYVWIALSKSQPTWHYAAISLSLASPQDAIPTFAAPVCGTTLLYRCRLRAHIWPSVPCDRHRWHYAAISLSLARAKL